MKIYFAQIKVWEFWHTEYNSGFSPRSKYFTTKEKAEKWLNTYKDKWINANNELVPIEKNYQKPTDATIQEIEVY